MSATRGASEPSWRNAAVLSCHNTLKPGAEPRRQMEEPAGRRLRLTITSASAGQARCDAVQVSDCDTATSGGRSFLSDRLSSTLTVAALVAIISADWLKNLCCVNTSRFGWGSGRTQMC